jgi:two-component system response regulator LytT
MNVKFQINQDLDDDEIKVIVQANQKTVTTRKIMEQIEVMTMTQPKVLPIKVEDQLIMVKVAELILVEVAGEKLTFFTKSQIIETSGHLNSLIRQLANLDFIQVSRHAVLNLNYLEALEAGFGGALVAKLTNGHKTAVSRRYVKQIEERLGI